jgi:flavin reductase (DIM6/NTAB) family NADH-FMN oxidoreductase RutF
VCVARAGAGFPDGGRRVIYGRFGGGTDAMGNYFLESELEFGAEPSEPSALGGYAQGFDMRALRDVYGNFATGVTVITAQDATGEVSGPTVNSFTSVSLDPPMLLVCFIRASRTLKTLHRARRFAVQILAKGQDDIAWHFAGKKMASGAPEISGATKRGVPCLSDALCIIDCDVSQVLPGGDHRIVLGEVKGFEMSPTHTEPLVFHRGRFGDFDPR